VFIVVALFGSLLLTQRAASNPLAGAWGGIDDQLIEVSDTISRLFPVGGAFKGGGGVSFGPTARISPRWFTDNEIAFTATIPASEKEKGLKWRAAAYDRFDLEGWSQSETRSVAAAAGTPLLADTPEDPLPDLTREIKVAIAPTDYDYPALLSLGTPTTVNRDTGVVLGSPTDWLAAVDVGDVRAGYQVTSRLLVLDDPDVISGNRLRAASEDYPKAISDQFTAVPADAMGADATELLAEIFAWAGNPRDPYDLAVAMEKYLQRTG
jgi:hypothetical protein